MASKCHVTLLLILLILSLTTFSTSQTSFQTTPPPTQPPTSDPPSTFSTLTPILTSLGYHDLALASATLTLSPPPLPSSSSSTPLTLFAPSDPSLRTCPTCSLPTLLQEHSLPALFPSSYLSRLPFSSRLESLLPGRCLSLTSAPTATSTTASTTATTTTNSTATRFFVNGAEITLPDLFTSPHLIIHGIQGYITHLSPYSCAPSPSSTATAATFPSLYLRPASPATGLNRMMLADAMIRLRTSGYSILALAIRIKYPDLITLHNMTIFAVDDIAIFHGGHAYVHSVRFHILPNRLLRFADLDRLPAATVLPTLEVGESLTVTSSGGGGMVSPMRINYVRVKFPDMLYNMKIVVHGLSSPFPRLSHAIPTATRQISSATLAAVSGFQHSSEAVLASASSPAAAAVMMSSVVPAAAASMADNHGDRHVESDDDYHDYAHHGL